MDSSDNHILSEAYENSIWPETLFQDLYMGPLDMCDDSQSVSSITSMATEEKMPYVHTRWGSTCSSPCDDSESLSSLGFAEEFPLPEESFWGADENIRAMKTQQNQVLEIANPGLSIPDGGLISEAVLQDPEFIKAMAIYASQQSAIGYINNGRRNETFLGQIPENMSTLNSNACDAFSSLSVLKLLEQTQRSQSKNESLLKQKPPLLAHEIKEEVKASCDKVPKPKSRRQPKASIPDPKRKKRKYERRSTERKTIQLYEFMLRLLDQKDDSVMWVSREEGVFKLLKSKGVAKLWGKYKKNDNMSYESLSRALRHYYALDILNPVPKKLHYKFCKGTLDKWYNGSTSS